MSGLVNWEFGKKGAGGKDSFVVAVAGLFFPKEDGERTANRKAGNRYHLEKEMSHGNSLFFSSFSFFLHKPVFTLFFLSGH